MADLQIFTAYLVTNLILFGEAISYEILSSV